MIGFLGLLGAAQGGVSVLAFVVLLLALTAVGLLVLGRARHPAPTSWILAGLAAAPALALTLWPDSGRTARGCAVEFSWTAPLDVQSLANVALLLPVAFFVTVASRRPIAAALAGAGLSAAIELAQDLLRALNRACTTQDWQMNTIGVVLGAALGWWVTRLADRPTGRARRQDGSRTGAISSIWTGTAIVGIAVWFAVPALNPLPSDPCDEQPAGATTVLPGGVGIRAGSQSGHLCIEESDGDRAGLGEDPAIGVLSTYGTGRNQWSVGVAPSGARTAHDARGTTADTHAVQGSQFRVWSTWHPATAGKASPSPSPSPSPSK